MLGDRLDHLFPVFAGFFQQIGGDFDDVVLGAQRLILPDDRLHFDQVDNAFELILGADGKLYRHWAAFEAADDGFD